MNKLPSPNELPTLHSKYKQELLNITLEQVSAALIQSTELLAYGVCSIATNGWTEDIKAGVVLELEKAGWDAYALECEIAVAKPRIIR